jgi:hypothetical protein
VVISNRVLQLSLTPGCRWKHKYCAPRLRFPVRAPLTRIINSRHLRAGRRTTRELPIEQVLPCMQVDWYDRRVPGHSGARISCEIMKDTSMPNLECLVVGLFYTEQALLSASF